MTATDQPSGLRTADMLTADKTNEAVTAICGALVHYGHRFEALRGWRRIHGNAAFFRIVRNALEAALYDPDMEGVCSTHGELLTAGCRACDPDDYDD